MKKKKLKPNPHWRIDRQTLTLSRHGKSNTVRLVIPTVQDARSGYRKILTESARKLNAQSSQLGGCIEKARPYYEARRLAKEVKKGNTFLRLLVILWVFNFVTRPISPGSEHSDNWVLKIDGWMDTGPISCISSCLYFRTSY